MRTTTVIDTGMMGTSIALALRAKSVQVYLRDVDPAVAASAAALGAGAVEMPTGPVDIAVIAVPPSQIADVLADCQANGIARVYTDVGSVKAAPLAAAEAIGCDLTNYVGGHPMAGSERSGPTAASPSLFLGRPWVLTPLACTEAHAIEAVTELDRLAGANPSVMTPADHDRAVPGPLTCRIWSRRSSRRVFRALTTPCWGCAAPGFGTRHGSPQAMPRYGPTSCP
jgi:prephenate dehydrogenase